MPIRTVFGEGTFEQLGTFARELAFTRALVVADRGIVEAGFPARAAEMLASAGAQPYLFHDFDANPDTRMVEAGRAFKVLAENHLGDGFMASPAIADRSFILRSRTHLYRVGS